MPFVNRLDDIKIFKEKVENVNANLEPQALYFIIKYQEILDRYYSARMYMEEINTQDWEHWTRNNTEDMKPIVQIKLEANFYETALIYYNVVIDLSWVLTYVSLETFFWKGEKAQAVFGLKGKEDAENTLRNLEKEVQTPLIETNQFGYLKSMNDEYKKTIELVEEFWKNIKDTDIRENYNFIKHRGCLAYSEIGVFEENHFVNLYFMLKNEEKIAMPSSVYDLQKKISLRDSIEKLRKFDDEQLYPYIKELVVCLKKIVQPSSLFDIVV